MTSVKRFDPVPGRPLQCAPFAGPKRLGFWSFFMYAVIETGGKQYRVTQGMVLRVEKLTSQPGETIHFDRVLAFGAGDALQVGAPYLEGVTVSARVRRALRGTKVRIVKMRRRKHYRKQMGHRQHYSEVEITALPQA